MKQKFNIEGMSCAACSAAVERAVKRLDGVISVSVNLLSNNMLCEYDEAKLSFDDIISAVRKAGFDASLPQSAGTAVVEKKRDGFTDVKTRLIISICFLIPLMYISMGHMLSLPFTDMLHTQEYAVAYSLTQLLLTLPVLYVNRKFYFSGFKALKNLSPNMDSLVAVGSCASVVYGIFSIYMIGFGLGSSDYAAVHQYMSNLYFESAAMILTLVTVGKYLEERSKSKTNSAITKLLDLSPKYATVIRDNRETQIEAADILKDDIVIIKPGERVPVDGIITEGSSSLDQSALTGESVPVDKTVGDSVLSASVNTNGHLKIRAQKVGSETTLAQIIELVENASSSKAPVSRLADKISGVFVPAVIAVSIVTCVVWLLLGQSVDFALGRAISVLVISCPCALGLATPVAITVAMGRSASKGILVKSAESLELLHSTDIVVLDKTGTVTEGKASVTDVTAGEYGRDELLKIAGSLEALSEHPLSRAVSEYTQNIKPLPAEDFEAVFGKGLRAKIGDRECFGGNLAYMRELGVDTKAMETEAELFARDGKTPLYFAREKTCLGVIAVSDTVKPTSREAVKELNALGLEVMLLTGDNRATAQAIKNRLEIDEVLSDVLPGDKEKVIADLQKHGKKIAMVGDGINDSPALSRADVGIAVSNGSDIAIDSADVVLMKNDLRDVAAAMAFSGAVMKNIRQNLFWAFFYNIIGIPVAAGVLYSFGILLNPMIASAAMSLSSLFVVTNAMRLYGK